MKRRSLSGPIVLIIALVAIPAVLCLGAVGYWRYVDSVPPFVPPSQMPRTPVPNGYEKAARAMSLLARMIGRSKPRTWPYKTPPDQSQALLAPVQSTLDDVRASFGMEWRAPPRLSLFPYPREYSDFRACALCFAAESHLARSQGDAGTTMQRSFDAMELGSKMVRGGGTDAWQVGGACHAIGFHDVEQIVPLLPAAAIPGALERVRRVRSAWPLPYAMWESERITMLASMTKTFRHDLSLSFADQADRARFIAGADRWKAVRFLLTPRRVVLANMDDYFRRQIAESKKPIRQRAPVPVPPDVWSRQILPSDLGKYDWRYEYARTELAILEVALAARLYRLQQGRCPADLRAIRRQWLPAVPVDQWGQPIAYRLRGGKPVIYSLGPDGKDDGGLAANVQHLGKTARGDLVFGKLTWEDWRKRRPGP
jgi:hypothetical protein